MGQQTEERATSATVVDLAYHDRAGDQPGARTSQAHPSHLVLTAFGVLVPLALLTWVATRSVITFDGGLNMHVASSIADGNGFAGQYGGRTVSPLYIQTSGPFLLLAAAAIKVFGTTPFGLQFANLLFLGVLLAGVSRTLRPWRSLQLVGPMAFVLITPSMFIGRIGDLGGYGEFAVGAFMIASFLLLAAVIEGAARPLLLTTAASAIFGLSLTTKIITLAEAPALGVGFVLAGLIRADLSRPRLALTSLGALPPILSFEIYRAAQFHSLSRWVGYWHEQVVGVGNEASGPPSVRPGMRSTSIGMPRLEQLGAQLGVQLPAVIGIFLVLPLGILAVAYLRHRHSWRQWIVQPRRSMAVLLAVVVGLYIPWYVFVSPIDWLRHFAVASIALSMLYLILCGDAITAWSERSTAVRLGSSAHVKAINIVIAASVGLALIVPVRSAFANVDDLRHSSTRALDAETVVSNYVVGAAAKGASFCGIGAMFASVVVVTSHTAFCDLTTVDACNGEVRAAFENGSVYVVWDDQAAAHYPHGPPPLDAYRFTKVAQPSEYASIWQVDSRDGACT